jgi:predicted ester cyclase
MAVAAPDSAAVGNKAVLCRYFEQLDGRSGNPAVIDEHFTPDCTIHFAGVGTLDPQSFKGLATAFYGAFPDLKHEVEDQVSEGNQVAARGTVRGTNRGEFQGVAATGRHVAAPFQVIQRIAGGKVAEYWVNFDLAGWMQQLTASAA